MEIENRNSFSTSPLTTLPPRQINTTVVSTNRSNSAESDDAIQQRRLEQQQSQQEARVVQQLRSRDREVRAHEAAHAAVGGQFVTGGPSFTYQTGPDGRSYAIGGEVRIDTSEVPNDPEATLAKAERVRRAALAPAQPSPQDLRVASISSQTAAQARIEIAVQRAEEAERALQEETGILQQATEVTGEVADENTIPANDSTISSTENPASVPDQNNLDAFQLYDSKEARANSFSLFA